MCSFYRPKESDTINLNKLKLSLHRAVTKRNAELVIAGDFNFPDFQWPSTSPKPRSGHPNLHKQFVDLLEDTGLVQLVTEPTRGENILDLVVTNAPSLIPRIRGHPWSLGP